MTRLNYQQVAQVAWDAGWRGQDCQIAVAIARAESGFDTMASNFRAPDLSYGLWQINMIGAMGPERRQKYGLANNEALFDPATNARVAYAIWKARGSFGDWSTYINRSYVVYLNGAVFAVKQIEQGKTGTQVPSYDSSNIPPGQTSAGSQKVVPSIPNPLDAFKFLSNKENWFRAAAVLGGGILIVLALALVASDTLISQALNRVGKASKVVKAVS